MNYYNEIKKELIVNEAYKRAKDYSKNRSDLNAYYNIGKLLIEAQGGMDRAKYGDRLIKEYSIKLTEELGKGYTFKSLFKMRQFYLMFEKFSTLSRKLSWSHYVEILTLKDINEINYYIKICDSQNLSVRELRNRIKNNEYERLDDKTKNKLVSKEKEKIEDYVKNPIIINNPSNIEIYSEKLLNQLIQENIQNFMKELGSGFSFIGSEYKIKIGNINYYIDLLLYNIKHNCYVVIELKLNSFTHKDIGQIEVYMNYVNKNIKTFNQSNTIGIILSKEGNNLIMEYCSDERIFYRNYVIS